MYHARDSSGNLLPDGARKRRGQAGYVTRDGTIYVPVGVGGRGSNHGEMDHEYLKSGKKYRNVSVDENGQIVPVPGPAGEWQTPQ